MLGLSDFPKNLIPRMPGPMNKSEPQQGKLATNTEYRTPHFPMKLTENFPGIKSLQPA